MREGCNMRETTALCPVCLKRLPAVRIRENGAHYIRRFCEEHGVQQTVIWRGTEDIDAWTGARREDGAEDGLQCPDDCGLCGRHLRGTCCTLLEVSNRCDLNCRFCFAEGGTVHHGNGAEPSKEEIKDQIDDIVRLTGGTLLQLSGGEPTMRDDLPELVAYALDAGCPYVQLNTNGLRLARDAEYLHDLAHAGLSFVFLQFDGLTDDVYETLRGRPMLAEKERAIQNCGEWHIGVTLVPTLVPGVNTHQVGDMIRYVTKHTPYVRGIHFQPVSYFGRMPHIPSDDERYTLGELIDDIVVQTHGLIPRESLVPSACDHPLCGLHGDYVVKPDGVIDCFSDRARAQESAGCCDCATDPNEGCCGDAADTESERCCNTDLRDDEAARQNREYIGRRWIRTDEWDRFYQEEPEDIESLEGFLEYKRLHGFTITSMAFQDAGNLDLERLRNCSLHVYRDGKRMPFCAAYLSAFPEEK